MKKGDKVKFIGCSESQIRWGTNDDPKDKLIIEEIYIIDEVEIHSWHTKVELVGIKGSFNSVCFEEIE